MTCMITVLSFQLFRALCFSTMQRSPSSHTKLHGHMPDKSVWNHEGRADREHSRMAIGKDLILRHEMVALQQGDLISKNSFYANGAQDLGQEYIAKHCHLNYDLVPFKDQLVPHSENRTLKGRVSLAQADHYSPPGRRHSAIEFNDPGDVPVASSPQRVPMEGQWRLTSSLSSPDLGASSPYQHYAGVSRRVLVPSQSEASRERFSQTKEQHQQFQADNQLLWNVRDAYQQKERHFDRLSEDASLAEFPPRWGFTNTMVLQEIPIRRRANLESASRATLTGPGCSFLHNHG